MSTSTQGEISQPAAPAHRVPHRGAAVVSGVLAAVAVWVVAVKIVDIEPTVVMGDRVESVGLVPVVVVSSAAGLLGWALLVLLESRSRRATARWTAVAVAVVVLSLPGPLTAAATPAAAAVLVLLHLVVAAVLIPALRRSSAGPAL